MNLTINDFCIFKPWILLILLALCCSSLFPHAALASRSLYPHHLLVAVGWIYRYFISPSCHHYVVTPVVVKDLEVAVRLVYTLEISSWSANLKKNTKILIELILYVPTSVLLEKRAEKRPPTDHGWWLWKGNLDRFTLPPNSPENRRRKRKRKWDS